MLSIDQLLKKCAPTVADLPRERVNLSEFGWAEADWPTVRVMTGEEKSAFYKSNYRPKPDGKPGENEYMGDTHDARLMRRTVCDDTGHLVFTDDHVAALLKSDCRIVDKVAAVAARLNNLDKSFDDLAKNS
jgi:hypothetical protein